MSLSPLLSRAGCPALLSVLLTAGLLFPTAPAHADSLENQIRQESLLRRYSSSEAASRYENYRRDNDAASKALGDGLTNLTSRLARGSMEAYREAERSRDQWEDMWFAVHSSKPMKARNAKEGRLMAAMLRTNQEHSWLAAKLMVEHMLWLHEDSPLVFEKPLEQEAAMLLRYKSHGLARRQAWSANMLGKMYLAGVGVPRDEEEALRIFMTCGWSENNTDPGLSRAEDPSAVQAQCLLNAATIHEQGWGVLPDAQQAAALREQAAAAYNKDHKYTVSAASVAAEVKP